MLTFYLTLIDNKDDRKLLEGIYYAYRKQMYSVALSVLRNEYVAEDFVHDIFAI